MVHGFLKICFRWYGGGMHTVYIQVYFAIFFKEGVCTWKEPTFSATLRNAPGDLYLGVVGGVRTGKSTFIRRFMELMVLPNMKNAHDRERTKDELPQGAAGRTVMTTEPKFIPNEAVEIQITPNLNVKMRMVDCVGYRVDGALGYEEDDGPRMVSTPWFEEPIPFRKLPKSVPARSSPSTPPWVWL